MKDQELIEQYGILPPINTNVDMAEETYFTKEQTEELKKLEYEAQRLSIVTSILESKVKIKQIQDYLASQIVEQPKKNVRTETDY